MLNNIKTLKSDKGFTIVELLIVIVVIAILAAITIVAYNGIQNRAKTTSGQSLANSIVKKMEAINAVKGAYTVTGNTGAGINTLASAAPAVDEAKIDVPGNVLAATDAAGAGTTAATSNDGKVVRLFTCTNGANVFYWNYEGSGSIATVKAGSGC